MPNTAQAPEYHHAEALRDGMTWRYQESHAARRSRLSRGPTPVTRTSLAGGAVVATANRWAARRWAVAARSTAARSTPGRQPDVRTVGNANNSNRISAGLIDASSTTVMTNRRIQPRVENTAMYMWSSTNT